MREQIEIESDLEKLAKAEASEAFLFFKDILQKQAAKCVVNLLATGSAQMQEEHDNIVRARAYAEMINAMPGKRWSLYQELIDLFAKAEAAHEARFKTKNTHLIRRYEDWKRQAAAGNGRK